MPFSSHPDRNSVGEMMLGLKRQIMSQFGSQVWSNRLVGRGMRGRRKKRRRRRRGRTRRKRRKRSGEGEREWK